MGQQIYKKLEAPHIRTLCVKCNIRLQRKATGRKNKQVTYRAICRRCENELYPPKNIPDFFLIKQNGKRQLYRQHKKRYCEECDFQSIHSCQLDVDHIDGNHKNDEPSNLRTLCANCHRLKTFNANEYTKKKTRG
jgi:5-methylcytosine-specific restriction endonuclease McrA